MQKGWKQAELKEEKLALSSQQPISEKNEILSLAASVFSIKLVGVTFFNQSTILTLFARITLQRKTSFIVTLQLVISSLVETDEWRFQTLD